MFYIIRFVLSVSFLIQCRKKLRNVNCAFFQIWFLVISYSYILEMRQELYAPVDPEIMQEIEAMSVHPSDFSGAGLPINIMRSRSHISGRN